MVKGALPVALVQLGYKSLTEDEEEAILDFIKGHNIFASLSTGMGKSLCLRQCSVHFWQHSALPKCALPFCALFELEVSYRMHMLHTQNDFQSQENQPKSSDRLSAMIKWWPEAGRRRDYADNTCSVRGMSQYSLQQTCAPNSLIIVSERKSPNNSQDASNDIAPQSWRKWRQESWQALNLVSTSCTNHKIQNNTQALTLTLTLNSPGTL